MAQNALRHRRLRPKGSSRCPGVAARAAADAVSHAVDTCLALALRCRCCDARGLHRTRGDVARRSRVLVASVPDHTRFFRELPTHERTQADGYGQAAGAGAEPAASGGEAAGGAPGAQPLRRAHEMRMASSLSPIKGEALAGARSSRRRRSCEVATAAPQQAKV